MPSLNYISFPEANYLGMQMFMKAKYYSHYKMISMKQICFRSTFKNISKVQYKLNLFSFYYVEKLFQKNISIILLDEQNKNSDLD